MHKKFESVIVLMSFLSNAHGDTVFYVISKKGDFFLTDILPSLGRDEFVVALGDAQKCWQEMQDKKRYVQQSLF